MSDLLHEVTVDHSERRSALAVRRTGEFQVRMARLTTGDYLIGNDMLFERKSVADLAASFVDGRLFPQVARVAHSGYRPLLLIEGSATTSIPDVHPHSRNLADLGTFRRTMGRDARQGEFGWSLETRIAIREFTEE
jgi:ERCC4-type nuclease